MSKFLKMDRNPNVRENRDQKTNQLSESQLLEQDVENNVNLTVQ